MPPSAVLAVLRRPRLWRAALHQVRVLAPDGWWRRAPFLPLPDREWMGFRMATAYGDPAARPEPDDVVTWLEWADRMPTGTQPGRRGGRG